MPGQTPIYKLPYAVSSDPLNQGAVAMSNLANRIEAVLSAAGVPAPPAGRTVDDPPSPSGYTAPDPDAG